MADIVRTYTIPSALVAELVTVFGQNYEAEIDGQPNPQTKAQFASDVFDAELKSYVRHRVVDYRRSQAESQVDQDFDIVAS